MREHKFGKSREVCQMKICLGSTLSRFVLLKSYRKMGERGFKMKSKEMKWLALLLLVWIVFPATAWAQDAELPAETGNMGEFVNKNVLSAEQETEDNITIENETLNTSMTMSEFEQKLSQFQSAYGYYNDATYRNSSFPLAKECHGYGRFLTQYIFGIDCGTYGSPNRGWVMHKDMSRLVPGDLVRYNNDNHTVFVTSVSGENVTITDANVPYGTNRIRWGIPTTKSHLNATLTYIAHYSANPVLIAPTDTTPPVIQRIWLDPQSGTGRMMYIEVSDNVDISEVWCPTWAPGEAEPFSKFATREPGTNIWKCAILGDDHGLKQGLYRTDVYAFDSARNQTGTPFTYYLDWEKPKISNIIVKDVSPLGYTVECTVSDNIGIDRVQFPTWLVNKTSPASDWSTNPFYSGSIQGNTVTYTVRDWDYSHVKGEYATHIYVYDQSGNISGDEAPVTYVTNEGKAAKEVSFDNHRYLLLNDALYWGEAKKAAENMGGHLVTITSNEEQNVVQNLISGAGRPAYFIGGTDEGSEGKFRWVTGESMTYSNWHGGNPDNWDGNENYMDMLSSGLWNDIPGNYPCGYIIEVEPNTPVEIIPLAMSYFNTDKGSNQVLGKSIEFSAGASGGSAPYQYRFYAKLGSTTMQIQDYTSVATATFIPNQAGSYTFYVDVKDSNGKTATKSIDNFVIYEEKNDEPNVPDEPSEPDDSGEDEATEVTCSYQTHVQNEGWQAWKTDGDMSGTSGKGLRLEGIKIKLDTDSSELGLSYATHVQNIGWQDPVTTGVMSGTSGKSLRLEAIKINLTGTKASQYDIYYRVHAQNVGWLGWAKNGESSGTAGFAYRLEGIEIRVLPKDSAAPGSTENAFQEIVNAENVLNKMVGTWIYKENIRTEENIITKLDRNKGHIVCKQFSSHYSDSMELDFYIYDVDNDGKTILYIDKNSIKSYGIKPTSATISVDALMNQPNKLNMYGMCFDRK